MVNLTDRAAAVLAQTLRDGEAGEDLGFRMVPSGPGIIALTIDSARDGDQVVRHRDQTVLVMEAWIARLLDGSVLDIKELDGGASLTLHGPRKWSSSLS